MSNTPEVRRQNSVGNSHLEDDVRDTGAQQSCKNDYASNGSTEQQSKTVTQDNASTHDTETRPPDGGWGWCVAVGSGLILVSVFLQIITTSLTLLHLFDVTFLLSHFVLSHLEIPKSPFQYFFKY